MTDTGGWGGRHPSFIPASHKLRARTERATRTRAEQGSHSDALQLFGDSQSQPEQASEASSACCCESRSCWRTGQRRPTGGSDVCVDRPCRRTFTAPICSLRNLSSGEISTSSAFWICTGRERGLFQCVTTLSSTNSNRKKEGKEQKNKKMKQPFGKGGHSLGKVQDVSGFGFFKKNNKKNLPNRLLQRRCCVG